VKCQVGIGPAVVGWSNLRGLDIIDMAISKEVVALAFPAPPAVVLVYGQVIAEPFGDENFPGWVSYVANSLRHRGLGIAVCVGGAIHIINLLRAMVEGHRVAIAGTFVFIRVAAVCGAEQNRRIFLVDVGNQIRLNEAAPAAAHP